MDYKQELLRIREDIDKLDGQLLELFKNRLALSGKVAEVKQKGAIAVLDSSRETEIINRAKNFSGGDSTVEYAAFMRNIMALSKLRQNRLVSPCIDFPPSKDLTPSVVGYQGVAGAWGEHAANTLFPDASNKNYGYFEDVFAAVSKEEIDYGVLPIENSQTGAIGEVYDLLTKHKCYITGQVWIGIAQCLLAKKDAELSDITEVFSHPQGFEQSRKFLKNKPWILTACRNTGQAAELVSQKQGLQYAAIGSRSAARAHGLQVLAPDIMDNSENKTRFIAIAKNPVYDEKSENLSVTFTTRHKSGALSLVIDSFSHCEINLSRIESRPSGDGRYRFFVDLQANILQSDTVDALKQAAMNCDSFDILGCYSGT